MGNNSDIFFQLQQKLRKENELYLRIKVTPNYHETTYISQLSDGTIKIGVHAKPEKGKANVELIRFLMSVFGVEKHHIQMLSGASTPLKFIKITWP